ncbi:MAG: hypothetical protein KAU50_02745 [Candidatus Marinimicrobia bacterium]|nr:hypothetical protein [Candidatus Neomarinimicrobiota bacterium]
METFQEYLQKTESAAKILFQGIDEYVRIIDTVPLDDVGITEEWRTAERRFLNESFAIATLCGAVLQLAYMAIMQYSNSGNIPEQFVDLIKKKPKPKKFCIGREIESAIPIGLIIYAGRNQAAHYDDSNLCDLNKSIFENLCERTSRSGKKYRDPAFDLNNGITVIFAANITSLLGWRSYDAYLQDILDMLSNDETRPVGQS